MRRSLFAAGLAFALGRTASAAPAAPKPRRPALSLSVRDRDAVRAKLEEMDSYVSSRSSGFASVRRIAERTVTSASGPNASADGGSRPSATVNICSAISSVSAPLTFSAPISTPQSAANATTCCCARDHSVIESSMDGVGIPILEAGGCSGNGTVAHPLAAPSGEVARPAAPEAGRARGEA